MAKIELNKSEQNENNALGELLKAKAEELAPFFDTVQILATRYIPEGDITMKFSFGKGNIYARVGVAESWIDGEIFEDIPDEEEGEE